MNVKARVIATAIALVVAGPVIAQDSDGTGKGPEQVSQLNFGPDDALEASFAAAQPLVTWKYYFVPASAFNRRSSSDQTTYTSGGCIQAKSDYAVSDIQIEDGASMAVLRVYYKDTDANNTVTAYVTAYDAAGNTSDYGPVTSTAATGYGTAAFTFSPYLVTANSAQSYVFNVKQAGPSTSTAICGARLFYSIP